MYIKTSQQITITLVEGDWSEQYLISSELGLIMLQNLVEAMSAAYYNDAERNKVCCVKNLRDLSGELTYNGTPVLHHIGETEIPERLGLKAAKLLVEQGWPS